MMFARSILVPLIQLASDKKAESNLNKLPPAHFHRTALMFETMVTLKGTCPEPAIDTPTQVMYKRIQELESWQAVQLGASSIQEICATAGIRVGVGRRGGCGLAL